MAAESESEADQEEELHDLSKHSDEVWEDDGMSDVESIIDGDLGEEKVVDENITEDDVTDGSGIEGLSVQDEDMPSPDHKGKEMERASSPDDKEKGHDFKLTDCSCLRTFSPVFPKWFVDTYSRKEGM